MTQEHALNTLNHMTGNKETYWTLKQLAGIAALAD